MNVPEQTAFTAELKTITGNGRGRHLAVGSVGIGKLMPYHTNLILHPI